MIPHMHRVPEVGSSLEWNHILYADTQHGFIPYSSTAIDLGPEFDITVNWRPSLLKSLCLVHFNGIFGRDTILDARNGFPSQALRRSRARHETYNFRWPLRSPISTKIRGPVSRDWISAAWPLSAAFHSIELPLSMHYMIGPDLSSSRVKIKICWAMGLIWKQVLSVDCCRP
ncbi:hypothetical protein BDV09DRAFT_171828 [Aspergillus tetrazonus]